MFPLDNRAPVHTPPNLPRSALETLPNHLLGAGPDQAPDIRLGPVLTQATTQNLEAATQLLQILPVRIPCCSIPNNI